MAYLIYKGNFRSMPTIQSSLLGIDLGQLVWTDAEYSAGKKYLKWEEMNVRWEQVELAWDEVFILLEVFRKVVGGGGGSGSPYRADGYQKYIEGNPWKQVKKDLGEESAKKLIRVYCRIKGIDYEESREPIEEVKVTINEFERFVREAVNVKVGF
jgi:hypothetical protein